MKTRAYFSEELVVRLNAVNRYINMTAGRATLHTLPFNKLGWGPVTSSWPDKSEFLFMDGHRLTLMMLVKLKYCDFVRDGMVQRRPKVFVCPLLAGDMARAVRLMHNYSRPIKSTSFAW